MFGNNLYNPGIFNYGMSSSGIKSLFSKFSLSSFLNSTSKTLNIINQAIPIYNQVKPMIGNAKTMLKLLSSIKEDDKSNSIKTIETNNIPTKNNNDLVDNGPTFFI